MNIVAVTGGRDFHNPHLVRQVLSEEHAKRPIEVLVHGGATGADASAGTWARNHGIYQAVFPAPWVKGPKAGPLRNVIMLKIARPRLLIAFPGGAGTDHCVRAAGVLGIEVVRVEVT